MAAAIYVLTHPLAPVAWWALNTPEVTSTVAGALGLDGDGAARRLQELPTVCDDYLHCQFVLPLVFSILIPLAIWTIEGVVYKQSVTDKRGPLAEVPADASMNGKDFKYGLFQCCDNSQYLLHGWCCITVRAADTFTAVGTNSFWCVASAFFICWTCAQLIGFFIMFGVREMAWQGIIPYDMWDIAFNERLNQNVTTMSWFIADGFLAIWLAGLRRKLRERLGDTNAGSKFCTDCLTYWCCSCCNVVQDARQIDLAQSVKVECCCKLVKTMPEAPPQTVGAPVVVAATVV